MNIFLYHNHTCGYSGSIQAIFPYPDNIICWSGEIELTPPCEYIAENNMIPSLQAGSYSGLGDGFIFGLGQDYLDCGLQAVWAHYNNGHAWSNVTTMLASTITVGHGNGIDTVNGDDNPNCGSYGPGLEFYAYKTTESACTPYVAAMMGRLMVDHPAWNFWDARAALRQTAWNYTRGGWVEDGGYGLLDWVSANALPDDGIELFAPLAPQIKDNVDEQILTISWRNFWQAVRETTVISRFDVEPGRATLPTDGEILYQGDAEKCIMPYNRNISGWIGFYTMDAAGNYSLLEDTDIVFFDVEYNYGFIRSSNYSFSSPARTKGFVSPARIKGFRSY